jgi:hypothetical protein
MIKLIIPTSIYYWPTGNENNLDPLKNQVNMYEYLKMAIDIDLPCQLCGKMK